MAAVSGGEAAGRATAWRRLVWIGPLAGVVAAAVNVVVYFVGAALGLVPEGLGITAGAVVLSTLVPALVATAVFAALGRFTSRPVRNFRVLAAILLVLSLVTPFTIPGATGGLIVILLLMHVVAAVVITGGLTANRRA